MYSTSGTVEKVLEPGGGEYGLSYDFEGNLLRLVDQRGNGTEYTYDYQGRPVRETNPLGKERYFDWDGSSVSCGSCGAGGGSGRLVGITDPSGAGTSFTYDLVGRVKRADFTGTTNSVEITYDNAGRATTVTDTRIPSPDWGTESFVYGYDAVDRLTTVTFPDGEKISYTYDCLNRRTSMTDPDGNVTTYHYANSSTDQALDYIEHPIAGRLEFDYDSSGWLQSEFFTRPGNVANEQSLYEYDSLGRPKAIKHLDTEGWSIREEEYTCNANAMLTRVDYSGYAFTPYHKLYSYDALGRLREEHHRDSASSVTSYRSAYEFDSAGNIAQKQSFDGSTTSTTNACFNSFNQIVETSGTAADVTDYTFDEDGNRIMKMADGFSTRYNHDRWGRLISVWRGDSNTTVSFGYDYSDRRILRTAPNGDKQKYYYDGRHVILVKEQLAGTEGWRTKRVYAVRPVSTGQIIVERCVTSWDGGGHPTAWTDRWHKHDLQGNLVAETDANGNQVAQYTQEAYGNVLTGAKAGYRLSGKEYDPEAGLYYFGRRWYDPATGVWVEPETNAIEGPNMYWYLEGDPVNGFDANGKERYPLPDGWSWDGGIKEPGCDKPDPNDPKGWLERPHLTDPKGKKYPPGDKLPKRLPGKVRRFVEKKGLRYKFQPINTWFEPAWEDLNPWRNPLMWIPIGAGAGAVGGAIGGIIAGGEALGSCSAGMVLF